jgi:threonine/homoserine/homoserine lactone efflux protein
MYRAVASLVIASLAIMGTPGPATISLTAAGSAHGFRRSLPYLAGIVTGTLIVLLAVATGVTAAFLALPAVRPVLIVAAVVYIAWLAYHIATAPPLGERSASVAPSLAGGALLGVANPKAWVAIAAVFASGRIADGTTADAAAKVAVLSVMVIVINGVWLAAGASLAPALRDPRRSRLINRAMAVLLVAAAVAGALE